VESRHRAGRTPRTRQAQAEAETCPQSKAHEQDAFIQGESEGQGQERLAVTFEVMGLVSVRALSNKRVKLGGAVFLL
jgi:hypothetical protein